VAFILIDLRRTIARHQLARAGAGWLALGAVLGLLSASGTLALGVVHYPRAGAGADVLAFVFALWLVGRVAQSALVGGDGILRPELFALLSIPRRRLARSLLVAGLADPSLAFLAVAFAALVALGAHTGVVSTLIALLALGLTLILTGVLSTIAGGLLGAGSRRRRDAGTIVVAVAISLVAVAGTLLPLLANTLEHRSTPWLSTLVRALPSGWGPEAVDAAARSDWLAVAGPLLGLVVLSALAAAAWPRILVRRMEGAAVSPRRAPRHRARRWRLPGTPAGAVVAKELCLWTRDPIRLTCLLIAGIVGAAVCAIPVIGTHTTVMLPFAGAMSALIAGACACNLYGNDGTSLWLTIATPRSARPDVRGRQVAWLLIVAPYTIAVTLVLTAISGQDWAWPWVLGGVPALLGGAAGLAAYGSLVSVQPLDDTGNPTPAWSLKVHLALIAIALTPIPPIILLAVGTLIHHGWLTWAAVPLGILTSLAATHQLGRLATRRLQAHQVTILRTIVTTTSTG
jgi:ABC-2 type transport system permease protein